MRKIATCALAFLVAGCASNYVGFADKFRGTLPGIAERQFLENLETVATRGRYSIPGQITLGSSIGTIGASSSIGFDPAINFRGIAITGLALDAEASGAQNLAMEPITDFVQIRRLQLFYSYVLHGGISFDDLEDKIFRVGNPSFEGSAPARFKVSSALGQLPPGPLVHVAKEGCLPGYVQEERSRYPFCFRDGAPLQTGNATEVLSHTDLLHLLSLWALAIPQIEDPSEETVPVVAARPLRRAPTRPTSPRSTPEALSPDAPESQRDSSPRSLYRGSIPRSIPREQLQIAPQLFR